MTVLEPQLQLAALGEQISGSIFLPGDPDWDRVRQAYNLTLDQQPDAVVYPADVEDVQRIVRFAAANRLEVAPQRTGHNAAPLGSLAGTILLKTDLLDSVELDPVALQARVGSGAKWEHVVPQASELGLAVLHGSTPDVSIAGYGLGGGVGWYGRKHGLFTNSITAIELVTGDGELRRVDHEHEPELFWALRGGGGSFGVVTAIEFRLFPISEVYAGSLFFPWERSAEVLHAWRDWTDTLPDEVTSVGRILQFPDLELVPEVFRGRAFVIVHASVLGTEAEGRALLEPLRELGPELDTFAIVPPVELSEMHMDPPDPVPYLGQSVALADASHALLDELLAVAGPDSGSTLVSVELRHTAGAFGRGGADHGALDTLPGSFLSFAIGMVMGEESEAATRHDLRRVAAVLGPHRAGSCLNFEEEAVDPARFYGAETYRRLREVKAAVDPDEVIRANHAIPPAR